MAYTLTLDRGEREAFGWVGDRYGATGDDCAELLRSCLPDGAEWDQEGPITFDLPQHVAWQIGKLAEQEDGYWPCFSRLLADKMQALVDSIV
jgi:hypothetical protein